MYASTTKPTAAKKGLLIAPNTVVSRGRGQADHRQTVRLRRCVQSVEPQGLRRATDCSSITRCSMTRTKSTSVRRKKTNGKRLSRKRLRSKRWGSDRRRQRQVLSNRRPACQVRLPPVLPPPLTALLKRVSRSFFLSVRVFPDEVAAPIGFGYLLARAADTIADTDLLPATTRLSLLELSSASEGDVAALARLQLALRELLRQPMGQALPSSEQTLLAVLDECLSLHLQTDEPDRRLVTRVLGQLVSGMQTDLRRFPAAGGVSSADQVVVLQSLAELDEYTYYAAGCVGEFGPSCVLRTCQDLRTCARRSLSTVACRLAKRFSLPMWCAIWRRTCGSVAATFRSRCSTNMA